ncbi:MAG: efflux RND transporter permease subunit [Planctomycetota bacterium]|nr:efflux RND transporter permease subunit [Planctomycetota bacterium]
MKSAFDRAMASMVVHRFAVTVLLFCMTVMATIGYVDPGLVRAWWIDSVATETDKTVQVKNSNATTSRSKSDPLSLFGGDAILVVTSTEFFTPGGADALRHVVAAIEGLEYVRDVLWMDRIPNLNIFGLSDPLFPRSDNSSERFAAARATALQHPFVGGQLLSRDGQTLLLLVSFDFETVRSDEQCTSELRQVAERVAREYPSVPMNFTVTGNIPSLITALRAHEANRLKYQVIGYGIILLMAVVLFRGIRAVLIVALGPALGVYWTIGFLRFFDLQDNPFNEVILPIMVSLVGFTDGVHLMVRFRQLRAAGLDVRDASQATVKDVGWACMLTSLTTAIGMGSLALAHNRAVQDFGWCSVLGIFVTFVSVLATIPLLCSTSLGRSLHLGHEKSLIDRNLGQVRYLLEWVLPRSRFVGIAGIISTLVLVGISLLLRPDHKRSNDLPEQSEAYRGLLQIDRSIGGIEFAEVRVRWDDDIAPATAAKQLLEIIRAVDEFLQSETEVHNPLSIRNLIATLPGERNLTDDLSMMELLPPPIKREFFSVEDRHAVVRFRVRDRGIAELGPTFERIEHKLREILSSYPSFRLFLDGDVVWRWRHLYRIVVDLARSLGAAAIIIFVTLGLCYRSWRLGVIAVIPTVFPLALTGTYLVVAGYSLEIVSVCALTVSLGVVVDDTTHFLSRYVETRPTSGDNNTAIRQAFSGVGVAMIMTTTVLVAGFATVAFSDSRDHHIFATMCAIAVSSALFGDLVILPALLSMFGPRKAT